MCVSRCEFVTAYGVLIDPSVCGWLTNYMASNYWPALLFATEKPRFIVR